MKLRYSALLLFSERSACIRETPSIHVLIAHSKPFVAREIFVRSSLSIRSGRNHVFLSVTFPKKTGLTAGIACTTSFVRPLLLSALGNTCYWVPVSCKMRDYSCFVTLQNNLDVELTLLSFGTQHGHFASLPSQSIAPGDTAPTFQVKDSWGKTTLLLMIIREASH